MILCLVLAVTISANPVEKDTAKVDKLPITFEDVIPSKVSVRGFNGSWISGK